MNKLVIFSALIAIISVVSCTGSEKSQYESIPSYGWRYGDTLMLQPVLYDTTDTVPILKGDLSVVVRHTNIYEYSNLWLRLDYNDADTIRTDTVNVILADEYGNWLGKGIGVSFQQSQPVLNDVTINLSQPVKVSHIMRADTLQGIEQIGVVFHPNQIQRQ